MPPENPTSELIEKIEYQHMNRNDRIRKEAERINSLKEMAQQYDEPEVAEKLEEAMQNIADGLGDFEEALEMLKESHDES